MKLLCDPLPYGTVENIPTKITFKSTNIFIRKKFNVWSLPQFIQKGSLYYESPIQKKLVHFEVAAL